MKFPNLIPPLPAFEDVAYPAIEPVPEGVHRPFWSVVIPTYNRPAYLEQTLRSVLEQDPGADEMQIEVIDNCSTIGDAEAIVRRLGGGRVAFYRQPQTVNPTVQGTTCIRRARGHWVHLMHDDDLVLPGFYTAYKEFIKQHAEVRMVFGSVVTIDENNEWNGIIMAPRTPFNGVVENSAQVMMQNNWVVAPSAVVAREAYEKVGGLHPDLTYLTDWELWTRLGMLAPVGYIRRPYLLYRAIHSGSESAKMVKNKKRTHDALTTIGLSVRRLPPAEQEAARREAYVYEARFSEHYRRESHATGQHALALNYALWAVRFHPTRANMQRLLTSALRVLRDKVLLRN
jgi:glycosyltransferase involved in cell wall biosynthesis